MKLILLQGLPGCGKSTIAKRLENKLPKSLYIQVDKLKLKALKEKNSWSESQKIAYNTTYNLLKSYKPDEHKYIIIEELFSNKNFINMIVNYINEHKVQYYWFKIERPIEELLKNEETRKRKIKNSLQDFLDLKKDIDKNTIKNQVIIKNSQNIDIEKIINQMLKTIMK